MDVSVVTVPEKEGCLSRGMSLKAANTDVNMPRDRWLVSRTTCEHLADVIFGRHTVCRMMSSDLGRESRGARPRKKADMSVSPLSEARCGR